MELFITAIYFILGGFCLMYIIIIVWFTFGWFSTNEYLPLREKHKTKVSVIIPARNEENNIIDCLNDLINQNYPKDLFEIIIIDDDSTDKTKYLVNDFINSHPEKEILLLSSENTSIPFKGKKQAIKAAVSISRGELIITSDADCRMGKKWILTIASFFESQKVKMIIGPVCFHNDDSVFKKLQNLEFLSLIASGAGATKISHPLMCNGANLAFSKSAYNKVMEKGEIDNFTSGDDIFLMLKIKDNYGSSTIKFLKNNNAIVYTEAKNTIKEFFYQRIRWVSKSRGYTSLSLIFTSLIIYIFNYLLLVGAILCFFLPQFIPFILILFLIKCIIDLPILYGITKFVKRKRLLLFFLPLQLIYILYISVIGFVGNFLKFEWKGRGN